MVVSSTYQSINSSTVHVSWLALCLRYIYIRLYTSQYIVYTYIYTSIYTYIHIYIHQYILIYTIYRPKFSKSRLMGAKEWIIAGKFWLRLTGKFWPENSHDFTGKFFLFRNPGKCKKAQGKFLSLTPYIIPYFWTVVKHQFLDLSNS